MKTIAFILTCLASTASSGAWRAICACLLILAVAPSASLADYQDTVRPLLVKYCLRCHGAEEQNARIRLDLVAGFEHADQQLWTMVHEAIANGEMPPEDEPQPTDEERQQILAWIMHVLFDIGELRITRGIPGDVQKVITDGKPIQELV